MNRRMTEAMKKSWRSLSNSIPIVVGIVLLVSLLNTLFPKSLYSKMFRMNPLTDSVIGSSVGSILAGNPVTSYIIGGEMMNQGVSLVAVTAFIVAWVTVGLIQMPAEALLLGKKFSLLRNMLSFIFSMVVAILTVAVVNLL